MTGQNNGKIVISYTGNESVDNRQGIIGISSSNASNGSATITIVQAGVEEKPVLSLNSEHVPDPVYDAGEVFTLEVGNTGGGVLQWDVATNVDWIDLDVEITEPETGGGIVHVSVQPYQGCDSFERYGEITVTSSNATNSSVTIEIYQIGYEFYSQGPDLAARSVAGPGELIRGTAANISVSYTEHG
jgi:hypothetical protein